MDKESVFLGQKVKGKKDEGILPPVSGAGSFIKGFITVEEKPEVKSVRIITRLFSNRHFAILKYKDTSLIDNMLEFNKMNYENRFGETWFVEVDNPRSMFSFSVGVVPWKAYKSALFSKRVDCNFRKDALKNRYGCFDIYPDSALTFCIKTPLKECKKQDVDGMSQKVRNTLKDILFHKGEIDGII